MQNEHHKNDHMLGLRYGSENGRDRTGGRRGDGVRADGGVLPGEHGCGYAGRFF